MGAFAYYRGDWDQAAALYQRALDAYRRAGNEIEAAMARYNSAEILLEQGRLDEAEATLHEVVSVYRAVGYRAGLAMTSRDLGRIAAYRGDLASAQRLLEESRETFAAYRAGAKVLEVDAHRADVLLRLGRVDDALAVLNETLAQAATAGTATVIPLLHRVHGQAWALAGQLEAAGDALGRSLEAASAAGARYDIALALESTAWVARLRGEEPDQADEDERTTLLSRLGVRATPVLPAGVR
jgi:non-specific serine/threonine protein kinase